MASINTNLFNKFIGLTARYEATTNRLVNKLLAENYGQASKSISKFYLDLLSNNQRLSRKALRDLRVEFNLRHKKFANNAGKLLENQLIDFAPAVIEATRRTFPGLDFTKMSNSRLEALAKGDPIVQGNRIRDEFLSSIDGHTNRAISTIRQGVLEGESLQKITNRYLKYSERIRRESHAIVRTATKGFVTESRMITFRNNRDIIQGILAFVTLDSATSATCRGYAGASWRFDDKGDLIPIAGSPPFYAGPPWHWNCRSEAQPDIIGQKYSVPSYEKWLKEQTPKEQRLIMGPTTQRLWSSGKISLRQTLDKNGDPLSVGQLLERFGP